MVRSKYLNSFINTNDGLVIFIIIGQKQKINNKTLWINFGVQIVWVLKFLIIYKLNAK
jgi:hypothetical protein